MIMKKEFSEIWTEKYRPQEFEDVIGQDEIVKRVTRHTNVSNKKCI